MVELQVDTGDLMPGSYGLFVSLQDALTGTQLLARSFPNIFEVAIPAPLRGVNEFRVLRWFYDETPEPVDLRLVQFGPPEPLPITKRPGELTGGAVLVEHRGEGGRFRARYWIAPAQVFGHGDLIRSFPSQAQEIPPHPVPRLVFFELHPLQWPQTPAGRYDALKVIENADAGQRVYEDWDDDVFEVPR